MDIRDNLRRRGIPFKNHSTDPNEIRVNCPFCPDNGKSPDVEFKLGVNFKTNKGHCFRCDYSTKHAIEQLTKKLSMGPVRFQETGEKKKQEPFELPKHCILLYKDWQESDWARRTKEYLEHRKITLDVMKEKLVLFTETGRYSHRAIFPVIAKEKLIGMVCRAILDTQEPRYLNSSGLIGIWNIPDKPKEDVILCEGIFKALAVERLGSDYFSVGAMLGHSLTGFQIDQLEGARNILLLPDPDKVGLEGALKIAYTLISNNFRVYLPTKIPTKQADEMTEKDLVSVLESFEPFSESQACRYKFQIIKRTRT